MLEDNMFFQVKGVAMEAPINGNMFVLDERSTDINYMVSDFHMSIRLLYEVDIGVSRDPVRFSGSIVV
jgi:hypothetical protein